ncbi:TOM1-like protein 2 isoform X2 [Callorhinchus milii]|uniref:TOM1-like protein 2 isoform X2 n=1 Tax=Callorhinchus milii TaxID=7868 RepID=UPI00045723B3|nr:TOM1-like protein 2 isoform X2 [Callorhinchus milii]|eukprot:gi/632974949/ref/XP_007903956.1/ PREDICTED: TOM1-like protein 2 isoform X2 [Callorhinchus milii]
MEFFIGNPYSTPVGQCIERATDGSLQAEDWTLNMEICDIINETEEGPKDAIRALKKRLSGNKNYREVMLALTVLETCIKNCGHRFHVLVASRDFIDGVLVKIVLPKNNPPAIVQDKVLGLIQSIPNLDTAMNKATPQSLQRPASANSFPSAPSSLNVYSAAHGFPSVHVTGPITPNTEQIARLRCELDVVRGNTKVMSEMLTEMVPGQEDQSDFELLQELNQTCRAMQARIVELLSSVSSEEITEELLHVNDDLNNVFLRYERFERYRSGRVTQSTDNGVLDEVTDTDNLIDLGPGSPAVVSPMVANTTASSLSSQLAGLDMGKESVSGTLSSLPNCNPSDRDMANFDMFAQTRSSSLADQRKRVTYEEPQALGGGLAPTLDVQQNNAAVKGDDTEEGVTSEEFDKFLEERAKAAERVPNLPTPPLGNSTPPTVPAANRKKPDRSEDALFAL